MKLFLISFSLFILYACNNKEENKEQDFAKDSTEVIQEVDTSQKDFHTTYTDIIENLFVFVNNKDWKTANSFYENSENNEKNADFFKNIFSSANIDHLDVVNISKIGNEIKVSTNVIDKGTGSSSPMCFIFHITGHRIIDQKKVTCN